MGMNLVNSLLFSDRTPKLIKRSLDFNSQKVSITSANIANSETPGYKAAGVEFQSVLQEAAGRDGMRMKTTNPNHINPAAVDPASLDAKVTVDHSQGRIDGNNVDIDKEVTTLAEAKIAYDAAITALTKRGSIVKSAVIDAR